MEIPQENNTKNQFENQNIYEKMLDLVSGQLDPEDFCIPYHIIYKQII